MDGKPLMLMGCKAHLTQQQRYLQNNTAKSWWFAKYCESGMWCQKPTYSLVLVILWFGIGEIQGGSRQEAGGSSRRCFLLSTKVSRLSVCCNKKWQSIKDPALMHSFTGHPEDLWNLSVFPLQQQQLNCWSKGSESPLKSGLNVLQTQDMKLYNKWHSRFLGSKMSLMLKLSSVVNWNLINNLDAMIAPNLIQVNSFYSLT